VTSELVSRAAFESVMRDEAERLDEAWAELVDKPKRGKARQTHARSRVITADMRDHYERGLSLAQVAERFGVTRQSVYDRFKRAGVPMRSRRIKPWLRFEGRRYTAGKDGYYRATEGDRLPLVHAVWIHHHGPIPAGYEVHNAGHPWTTDVEDLHLVDRRDRRHLAGEIELRWCEHCGFLIPRKKYRPKAYGERRFCSPRCKGLASKREGS